MSRGPSVMRDELVGHPELPAGDREVVEQFVAWCEAYAALEQTVLGDLSFDVPVHGVELSDDPGLFEADATALAGAAMRLLSLEVPVTRLSHALEAHGARVFRMPLERGVLGAFFFAGETAPAFLVNTRLTDGAARIALAHLYAHFLVDVDPYEPAVCRADVARRRPRATEDLADRFACALLVPVEVVEPFVAATEIEEPVEEAIADYLELPVSFVVRRLAALGYDAGDTEDVTDDDWWQERTETVFPERLVALALEGIHEGKIDVDEFSTALGISRDDAIRLLSLSAVPAAGDESDGWDAQPEDPRG